MTQPESKRQQPATTGETTAPAVGILATQGKADHVAGAILRAREHSWTPIVTGYSTDIDGIVFARALGAEVVTPATEQADDEQLWSAVRTAARERGHPGVLCHTDVTQAIDFAASQQRLSTAESYAITPTYTSRVDVGPEILVAIPAYNEAQAINQVVTEAAVYADEVLVIDDGSTDDTVAEARAAGATVIEHETNTGYGGALQTAFTEAKRAGAAHLAILDGDGQHDPADIPRLVERQQTGDANIVIGSRFEEAAETELPLYRRVGLRVVNTLTNLSLGVVRKRSRIDDTQSGFRVYDETAIASLAEADEIGNNMGASTDILYHAHRHGYDIEEVGTTIDYDVEDASSQNPVSHGLQLVQNILRTVERERPVTVLGVPGFVSAILGLGFGYFTFSNYITTGTFPLGLAIVSVFFTLAGIFAAFTAIILHSLNTHLDR